MLNVIVNISYKL